MTTLEPGKIFIELEQSESLSNINYKQSTQFQKISYLYLWCDQRKYSLKHYPFSKLTKHKFKELLHCESSESCCLNYKICHKNELKNINPKIFFITSRADLKSSG